MVVGNTIEQATSGEATPLVWLLFDDRPGHMTQVVGIADALGWPSVPKHLRFHPWNHVSNNLLGASLLTLDRARSDPIEAPWPDLVIAMGRRSAPVARWIHAKSGGRARLVQLGRKGANITGAFDLTVACKHFQLPPHPSRLDLVVPPAQVTAERLTEAATKWADLFTGAPSPRVVLLVGGDTVLHELPPQEAGRMAKQVLAFAREAGGSLSIVTSRRTSDEAVAAMQKAAADARFHIWRRNERENPYLGYIAGAEVLVVTGESESMLAEAAASGRSFYIYPLAERRPSAKLRLKQWVFSRIGMPGLTGRFCRGIIENGWLEPPRDLDLFHRELVGSGLARPFGDSLVTQSRPPGWPEERVVVARIRKLLDMPVEGES